MRLEDNILNIKGIGKARAEMLNRLGICCVRDLVEFYPRDYQDRSISRKISELLLDEINTVKVEACSKAEVSKINDLITTRLKFKDESGDLEAVWYNQPYLKNYFSIGQKFMLTGKAVIRFGRKTLISPEYEVVSGKELLSSSRIVPVYSLSDLFSQKVFRGIVHSALSSVLNEADASLGISGQIKTTKICSFADYLPERIRDEYKLVDKEFAIRNIHFPIDADSFFMARKRLVFDEIFLLRLALNRLKQDIKRESPVIIRDFSYKELLDIMPFKLTEAQEKTVGNIIADFKSGMVMNRLVQGDVGSGKTAIAVIAAYIAIKNGYQAIIMAPTEVLASQHYTSIKIYFDKLGIATELLSGSLKKKDKLSIYERIKNAEIKMLIGTHSVIQDGVEFCNAALVITDEQHRFGVRQRARLSEKGVCPHMLAMSATPIPRTLALILYGDLDISIIDTMPPGRRAIQTFAVNSNYRDRYFSFLNKQIEDGRQAYVICASIGDDEEDFEDKNTEKEFITALADKNREIENVLDYADKVREALYGHRVEILHGKMKKEEKNMVMDDFAAGKTDALVSTTVIEVGINVPNASVIVIENAERFGLAQLHQLRGRVGRGEYQSYCILVSDSKSEASKERMKIMTQTCDGFIISEKDLSLRGQGDFFGTKQHGLPDMRIANLFKDMDVLEIAGHAADRIIDKGLSLDSPELERLLAETDSRLKFGVYL